MELFYYLFVLCGKGIMVQKYLEAPDLRGINMKALLEKANRRRLEAFEAVDPEARNTTAVGVLSLATTEPTNEVVIKGGESGTKDDSGVYFVQAHV